MGAKNKKAVEAELRCMSSASALSPTTLSEPWDIAREDGYHRDGMYRGTVVLSCSFPTGFSETIIKLGALVGFEGAGRAWVSVIHRAILVQIVKGNFALDCSEFVQLLVNYLSHPFEGSHVFLDDDQQQVWEALPHFTNGFALAVLVDEVRRPFIKGASRAAGEIEAVMAAHASGLDLLP